MVVGISGGIASGKTVVSNIIKKLNYPLIDCDEISHQVFDLPEIQDKIRKEILNTETITRKDVSDIVFKDKEKLQKLNAIMHPYILDILQKEIKKYDFCFVDCPLLYDLSLEYLFDKIIFVYANKEKQIERLMVRNNINYEDALLRINNQMAIDDKLSLAKTRSDYIVYNNDVDINELEKEVKKIVLEIEEEKWN